MASYTLHHGDCLEYMRGCEPDSVDTIITDPPYGLSFMGKDWDRGIPGVAFWDAALRVAKPGAMMLAFGGTRTFHRLTCAIEDAGWEIRDCMMWLYGSGFPKSHDISKGIDKAGVNPLAWRTFSAAYADAVKDSRYTHSDIDRLLGVKSSSCYWARLDYRGGLPPRHHWNTVRDLLGLPAEMEEFYNEAEREAVGVQKNAMSGWNMDGTTKFADRAITTPATPYAATWNGWGTALKPAWEPIIVAMKPLDGTFAQNAIKHGVAGLHIDGARIETNGETIAPFASPRHSSGGIMNGTAAECELFQQNPAGRWPANLILDEEAAGENEWARYFYVAKASRSEREQGLEGMGVKQQRTTYDKSVRDAHGNDSGYPRTNHHPTVKPLRLMEYLCTLTATPTGGVVLDPFMGSGTTGIAAINTGRRFIGIELNAEYLAIAQRRIEDAAAQLHLFTEGIE